MATSSQANRSPWAIRPLSANLSVDAIAPVAPRAQRLSLARANETIGRQTAASFPSSCSRRWNGRALGIRRHAGRPQGFPDLRHRRLVGNCHTQHGGPRRRRPPTVFFLTALAQKFKLEEVRTALLAMSAVLLLIGLYYVGSYPRV